MIADRLENCTLYYAINPGFEKAFAFIRGYMKNELPDGRYDIDGEEVYALVQSYETLDEREVKWEAHKKYIDLQFVVKGKEIIGWKPVSELTAETEYDGKNDCILYAADEGTGIKLQNGWFAVLFPEDGHKPKCMWEKSQKVKKIVLKIKA